MYFAAGLLAGLLLAGLWKRIRRRGEVRPSLTAKVRRYLPSRRCTPQEQQWLQIRNFLRYDGSVMPEIKKTKERVYE